MKEYFLGDSLNVDKEGAGVPDISLFVEGSVSVSRLDGFF